jgi:hypothetical protein
MKNPPLIERSLDATANRDAALMQFTLRNQRLGSKLQAKRAKASEMNATTLAANLAKEEKVFELAAAND